MIQVVAYARVSTDTTDQANSLENQITFFKSYIKNNPHWDYKGIYVDEGITGTNIRKREGFKRMIEDAYAGKFNLILTKEISRFARNTLDSIYYTRKLKELNIGVIFLNDGINTLDADGELRLTIMASIAQEESRKTSQRVKWGQKRSMEQGTVFGRSLLGYEVKEGALYVNEETAKIVREIFCMFVHEKKGVYTIAKELTQRGIPTALGNKEWHGSVILKILKNEKYCGDLLQKKTYTPDYLLHEKKINRGQEEKIYIKNHHEGIIDRSLFEMAQKEIERRSNLRVSKEKYSNRYCFSGIVKCGLCGASYVSRKKNGVGKEYRYWKCYEGVRHGKKHKYNGLEIGCNNVAISDEDLKIILMNIVNYLRIKEGVIRDTLKVIPQWRVYNNDKQNIEIYEKEKKLLENKIDKLLNLYLENVLNKEEYLKKRKDIEERLDYIDLEVSKRKEIVKEKNESILEDSTRSAEKKKELGNIKDANNLLIHIIEGKEFHDQFYNELLENIVVYNKEIKVKLKGISNTITIIRK